MMHVYLMAVRHYFTGEEFFRVSAKNKTDALDIGKNSSSNHRNIPHRIMILIPSASSERRKVM